MMRSNVPLIRVMLILSAMTAGSAMVFFPWRAQAKDPSSPQRAQYLDQMKSRAEATEINLKQVRRKASLIATPVFRYDDQPRRFLDATMWAWTDEGRPVAFEKVEVMIHRNTNMPLWGYCLTSVSEELLVVNWTDGRRFESKEPGIDFQVIADAPAVAERDPGRRRQARELVRGFSARAVLDPRRNDTQELRLLTTPILEYSDPRTGRYLGSVFGFSTNGTNPDLLVLFEPRSLGQKMAWHFAPARMTSGGVTLNFHDKEVWETPHVDGVEAPFDTWTFFSIPRTPLADEKS